MQPSPTSNINTINDTTSNVTIPSLPNLNTNPDTLSINKSITSSHPPSPILTPNPSLALNHNEFWNGQPFGPAIATPSSSFHQEHENFLSNHNNHNINRNSSFTSISSQESPNENLTINITGNDAASSISHSQSSTNLPLHSSINPIIKPTPNLSINTNSDPNHSTNATSYRPAFLEHASTELSLQITFKLIRNQSHPRCPLYRWIASMQSIHDEPLSQGALKQIKAIALGYTQHNDSYVSFCLFISFQIFNFDQD